MNMALYTIIRIYEVPAENRIEATDRMREALSLHVEKDYHVKDVIREPREKLGQVVRLEPPASWLTLLFRQLVGRDWRPPQRVRGTRKLPLKKLPLKSFRGSKRGKAVRNRQVPISGGDLLLSCSRCHVLCPAAEVQRRNGARLCPRCLGNSTLLRGTG